MSFSGEYDNCILLGDFKADISNTHLKSFCELYSLKCLIKEPTCFKNIENPTCIDLILTNHQRCFQNSSVVDTGLSDFHKLTVTVLKTYFKKQEPKIIRYRDFKKFSNQAFRDEVFRELSFNNIEENDFERFQDVTLGVLNNHAPVKEKHIRCNQSAFITKEIRKAIMNRSKLLNKFRKDKTKENKDAYNKQRNFCVGLMRKTKKDFYNNLDVKNITDNKQFWKTVKPFFSDKLIKDEKSLSSKMMR